MGSQAFSKETLCMGSWQTWFVSIAQCAGSYSVGGGTSPGLAPGG
eukprot:CAMPEP_0175769292 /NCGR_PEP_ID=MMETSP0097-20121207/70884_1 /TAXON_ID=311494 /ORGANISM="Alexandrium monilatum, Strain CCMP3105" /LENGTH=44 /DNA_ID= /DNA_START= /DNA_END= /DNA_ORIENTATION=